MTYILVESPEDKAFLSFILANLLSKSPNDYKIETNGSWGITDARLNNIKKHLESDNNNVLVINDADTDFQTRMQDLKKKLKGFLNIEVFLFPNNADNGELEDLLLDCIPNNEANNKYKIINCFNNSFIPCVEKLSSEYTIVSNFSKTRIHAYVDAQVYKNNYKISHDGAYLYKLTDLWDFKCKAIQPLLDFLKQYVY